jgi:hypothetical protein
MAMYRSISLVAPSIEIAFALIPLVALAFGRYSFSRKSTHLRYVGTMSVSMAFA